MQNRAVDPKTPLDLFFIFFFILWIFGLLMLPKARNQLKNTSGRIFCLKTNDERLQNLLESVFSKSFNFIKAFPLQSIKLSSQICRQLTIGGTLIKWKKQFTHKWCYLQCTQNILIILSHTIWSITEQSWLKKGLPTTNIDRKTLFMMMLFFQT